jgi:hypothetical protein
LDPDEGAHVQHSHDVQHLCIYPSASPLPLPAGNPTTLVIIMQLVAQQCGLHMSVVSLPSHVFLCTVSPPAGLAALRCVGIAACGRMLSVALCQNHSLVQCRRMCSGAVWCCCCPMRAATARVYSGQHPALNADGTCAGSMAAAKQSSSPTPRQPSGTQASRSTHGALEHLGAPRSSCPQEYHPMA